MKKGIPIKEVTIPIGKPIGGYMILLMTSHIIKNTPPESITKIIFKAPFTPKSERIKWGMNKPMNPIGPVKATLIAVKEQ